MGCFGSKTETTVVAVKPPTQAEKMKQGYQEDQWNVAPARQIKSNNTTAQLNNSAVNQSTHRVSGGPPNNGHELDQSLSQRQGQKSSKRSLAHEQQGYMWNHGDNGASSSAGLAGIAHNDDSSPMLKMASNLASNNSSTMKIVPSVQEPLPMEGDYFEEYMQQMKNNEEQREQLKQKRMGTKALDTSTNPLPQANFVHENTDKVREHAAQILKNPEAIKQMSKNTFQLPPLNAHVQKKFRKDNEQQLTEDFYKMLSDKKNIDQNTKDEGGPHNIQGYDSLEPLPRALKLAQKKSRKDELDNLLCELRDNESDSNVSVAGSHQFSNRNPMDEDVNNPVMLPPLTNRTSNNNQVSSLPAIQNQKKPVQKIKEIDFEAETPANMGQNSYMSPYIDQFMSVHSLNQMFESSNGGMTSPKDKILVYPGQVAQGHPAPSAIHKAALKNSQRNHNRYQNEEEEEDEFDF